MAQKALKKLSWEEIGKHDNKADCWIVIRGKVYDVTSYVDKHPGGSHLYLNAGKDCTQVFEGTHPTKTWGMVDKFLIGEIDRVGDDAYQGITFGEGDATKSFYYILKKRVEDYMQQKKIPARDLPAMYLKSFSILFTIAATWYATMYFGAKADSFLSHYFTIALFTAAVLGVANGAVGVCIQHDANHGGYSNNKLLSYLAGATLELIGASSFMWKQQHNIGHHVFTNIEGLDPDIRVSDPDVRRVTKWQPYRGYHKYQHVYLLFLYGLLALKGVFVDDFVSLKNHRIGVVKFRSLTFGELCLLFFGKVYFVIVNIYIPLKYWLPFDKWIVLFLVTQFATGYYLAYMFQVGHVVEKSLFSLFDPKGKHAFSQDWGALQVASSANFAHGSAFWTFISGGLNYQIEHHLFPSICHINYPKITHIVQQTCKEYGVPYPYYDTYADAFLSHVRVLKQLGQRKAE